MALPDYVQQAMASPQGLPDYVKAEMANKANPTPYDVEPGVASAMNIGQALTFGFGDELAGAASVLGGGDYSENRDKYRATVDKFKQEYPKSALLGTVSGGLLQGAAGAKALPGMLAKYLPNAPKFLSQPLTTADTLKNTATIGAVSGAAQGAGDAENTGGVPAMAAMGLGLGAVGGPIVQGVARGGSAVTKRAASFLSGKIADNLAQPQVARALIRDTRAAIPGLDDLSDLEVLDIAVKKTGGRLQSLGDRAVLADAGPKAGKETRGLLDTMATLPGSTSGKVDNLVHARKATRGRVLQNAAADGLSPGGQRSGDLIEDLISRRSATSKPLYEALHQESVTPTPELDSALQSLQKLGAFKKASKIGEAELGAGSGGGFQLPAPGQPIKVKDLDRIKQGLDTLIERETKEGKTSPVGRAYIELKRKFVGLVDDATVDPLTGKSLYKQARDAYAGPSALITAVELGRKAAGNLDDAAIRELKKGLGDSELEAFKVGAFEGLRAKVGRVTGASQIINMWENPGTSDALKEIFGSQRKFREFAASVAKEARIKRLDAVGQGSQTAGREARMDDLNGSVFSDMGEAAKAVEAVRSPSQMLQSAGRLWGRVATPEPVRNAIGNALLSKPTQPELNALRDIMIKRAQGNALQSMGTGIMVPGAYQTVK